MILLTSSQFASLLVSVVQRQRSESGKPVYMKRDGEWERTLPYIKVTGSWGRVL